MRRMRYGRRRRSGLFIFALLTVAILLLFELDAQIRPIIKTVAANQAEIISTKLINEAVSEVLKKDGVTYNQLVSLDQNSDGVLTSLKIDSVKINSLKAQLTTAIADKMVQVDQKEIGIPIGTLLGGDIFSGRGFKVVIRLSLGGNVITQLHSSFISAGINQTNHQILLNVEATIYALIPGYNTSTAVKTDVLIAETVIVGTVPEAYTLVETGESDPADVIANYGAATD